MAVKKQNQSGSNQENNKTGTNKLFDMLNPNSMLTNAQKVISTAVDVLEEEIAAGIIAAKKIEKKVINVDEIRDDNQNLMNRIRRDTHEALDIFLDALAALSKQVGLLTDSVTTEAKKTTAAASTGKAMTPLQVIEHDGPVKAGEKIELSFLLSDDALKEPVKLDLHVSDFAGAANQKINAKNITLTPASFILKPGEEKKIIAKVTIAKNCKPGYYNSLLTVTQVPAIKMVLSLQVE